MNDNFLNGLADIKLKDGDGFGGIGGLAVSSASSPPLAVDSRLWGESSEVSRRLGRRDLLERGKVLLWLQGYMSSVNSILDKYCQNKKAWHMYKNHGNIIYSPTTIDYQSLPDSCRA